MSKIPKIAKENLENLSILSDAELKKDKDDAFVQLEKKEAQLEKHKTKMDRLEKAILSLQVTINFIDQVQEYRKEKKQ